MMVIGEPSTMNLTTPKTISASSSHINDHISVTINPILLATPEYLLEHRLQVKKLVRKYMQQIGLGNHHFKKTMDQLENCVSFIFGDNAGYLVVDVGHDSSIAIIVQYYNMTLDNLNGTLEILKQSGKKTVIFQSHSELEMIGWKKGPRIYSRTL